MAVDYNRLSASVDRAIAELTRVRRDIDAAINPLASGDYSDLGMLSRGVQPGSPEAEADTGTPPVSAITHGAADMREASGGRLDNEGNPTGKPTTDPKPNPNAAPKPNDK